MSNKRIALNTVVTYTRTILAAALALFSSRWVLNALGQTDFGLFSVVGSLIIFITFLNTVMAGSAARHFAYSLGRGDHHEVTRWFNSAVGIHLCLASFLLVAGSFAGEYTVRHVLVIPHERVASCLAIFRISLVSAFVSMAAVPFVAMFSAKQHFTELAVWGMLQAVLSFVLAWFLRSIHGDRLLVYSVGMVGIVVLVQLLQIVRAFFVFRECTISWDELFDRERFKGIFSFAVWNLIGSSGALFRDQGSAILLNVFFGPAVNAAYGIACQVSNQTNQLSAAMISAFSPEITACEGRGDRKRMLALSGQASKFGTILVLLLAIPLIIEAEYVLKLWLHAPPPHSALFCQLILVTFLIDRLSSGYMLAVNAHGRIAGYQATLGTALVLTLPLSWLFLKMGMPPTSIGIAFIVTMAICSIGRVAWGRHLLGMPVWGWFTGVAFPSAAVAFSSAAAALLPAALMPPSFQRLLLVTAVSCAVSVATTWLFALDSDERDVIGTSACRVLGRLGLVQGGREARVLEREEGQ